MLKFFMHNFELDLISPVQQNQNKSEQSKKKKQK
jgi:hypothetical protein